VGEIRDLETGGIAIKAALTGHLVFSTLHTNDAPSTIVRMIDMGLEPFNVAAALNVITAQRLVRRICKNCKEEAQYTEEYLEAAGLSDEEKAITYYRGRGCEECSETGYKGRQGLYEVMAATPSIRKLIMEDAGADELKAQALREGMLTLHMDGLKKAARGITTLEEVIKETTI
jgi:type IV pilus assembly protein PilB